MDATRPPVPRRSTPSTASDWHGRWVPLLTYLLLAFAVTWVVWAPRALAAQDRIDAGWVEALGGTWTYGPAVAAVLAAAWTGGRPALRELRGRVLRWRVGWGWLVLVVVGLPVGLQAATLALAVPFGAEISELRPTVGVVALLVAVVALSLTDGLGEEVGWRGYALPRLLERTRAVDASLLLGVVWAVWHLPLLVTPGSYLEGMPLWVLLARLPATSILFTWVFRHTGGSALVAVLLHGALNATGGSGPSTRPVLLAGIAVHWAVAGALVLLAGRDLDRWPGPRRPTGADVVGSEDPPSAR
jgi:membrane protease YdiL (CAAX protease family)